VLSVSLNNVHCIMVTVQVSTEVQHSNHEMISESDLALFSDFRELFLEVYQWFLGVVLVLIIIFEGYFCIRSDVSWLYVFMFLHKINNFGSEMKQCFKFLV
jgi:hypothetical protein